MSVTWPIPGSNGGTGRLSSGKRITGVSTGQKPGLRLTIGAGGSGTTIEVFYDVYLRSVTAGPTFNYTYRYWYREVVEQGLASNRTWVVKSESKPRLITSSGSSLTTVLGQSLPVALPFESFRRPGEPNGLIVYPTGFGWKGDGQGTKVGTAYVDPAGNAPFQGPNPFGAQPDNPPPQRPDEDNDGDGTPNSEENGAGAGDSDPGNNPGPPIPGFDKKRKTEWNPPPVNTITGAYIPVVYDWEGNEVRVDETEAATRQSLLGYGSYASRVAKKGRIVQWIQIESEWRATAGSATDKDGNTVDTWDSATPLVPTGVRYGFRFTYNPSEIQFQMNPIVGLDPGVIISGLGRSFPMGDEDGGSIQLTTYLNRIEDMAFIKKSGNGFDLTSGVNPYGNKKLTPYYLKGIATRGTGFDLEYLFRTSLGRAFPTKTRGVTADIGLILGLPLLLNLGGGMSYTGRLTGLSYTHMYFTADMVPTYTAVSMSFTRFPDATSFNRNPNPGDGGNGKNKPGKKPGSKPSEYGPPGARNP